MNTYAFLLSVYTKDKVDILRACLESIVTQTHLPNEVIVVAEGNLCLDLKSLLSFYSIKFDIFKVVYVDVQFGQLNFGLPACLNLGIAVSSSDFIVRIDSDDINVNNRLERIDSFLSLYPSVKLIGSNVCEYNESLSEKLGERKVPEYHNEILRWSKLRNPFNGPAIAFSRLICLQLGGYPIVASNEDYCLWAKFLMHGIQSYNIQESLVIMRAGDALLRRRSSLRYIQGEILSYRYLYGIGYVGLLTFLLNVLSRSVFRFMPFFFIRLVYFNLLRNRS